LPAYAPPAAPGDVATVLPRPLPIWWPEHATDDAAGDQAEPGALALSPRRNASIARRRNRCTFARA
jgi:hypothetical protein